MHFTTSIFEEAKRRLTNYFIQSKRLRTLLSNLIDEMSIGRLATTVKCWQALFMELDYQDFPFVVSAINEIFGGRGVEFDLAVMPGTGANAASVSCLSISLPSKNRVILLPLVDDRTVELCQTSKHFLGSHYWMEPVRNENPELAFRQMISFLSVDPLICPPPLTGMVRV